MSKVYDAANEFKKFELSEKVSGHPRPRTGATAKKTSRALARSVAAKEAAKNAPVKGKKK